LIRAVWNEVGLAAQLRNPEAVIRVRGEQLHERRPWVRGIAHGDVQLVRGDDPEAGVAELPPELMTDDGDVERAGWPARVLHGVDHARGGQEQHEHDQARNDGPGELDLRAAVDLGRFTIRI